MPLSFCVKNQISQKDQKNKVPRKSKTKPNQHMTYDMKYDKMLISYFEAMPNRLHLLMIKLAQEAGSLGRF
jgi:hypothetical protein